ncbi:MAG: SGNH/GDSL hydrolase family protein, partial [Methanomicrobium sp.]|nr:SGNH/GDSL hydrolase family protein [Methanomicrobium sp.]
FLTVLEDRLQKLKGNSFEVIKAGTPGVGPQTYLSILKQEGIKYNPDLVLVNIFVGNDIFDIKLPSNSSENNHSLNESENKITYTNKNINSVKPQKQKSTTALKDFLRRNLHLYSFVVDRLKNIPFIRHFLQKNNIASGLIGSYVIDILKKEYSDEYKAKWNEMFCTLTQMKEISDNLIVVIIPTREQVDSVRLEKALKQLDYKKDDIDIYHPNNLIKDYCTSNNILCIDMLPIFKQSTDQPLYFEIDPHFNTEGHKLAANTIFNELIANKIIN